MPFMSYIPTINFNVPSNVFQRHYFIKFNPEGKVKENNIFNVFVTFSLRSPFLPAPALPQFAKPELGELDSAVTQSTALFSNT